jgi:hypothetical protein
VKQVWIVFEVVCDFPMTSLFVGELPEKAIPFALMRPIHNFWFIAIVIKHLIAQFVTPSVGSRTVSMTSKLFEQFGTDSASLQ